MRVKKMGIIKGHYKRKLKKHYKRKFTEEEKLIFDAYLKDMLSIKDEDYDTFETIDKLDDKQYKAIVTANFKELRQKYKDEQKSKKQAQKGE
jgi:hypothetical protein